jgi:hypothetical protein
VSFLVIDFKYLYGRYAECVVKGLTIGDASNDRVLRYKFKKPYDLEEVLIIIRGLIQKYPSVVTGMIEIYYIQN